MQACEVKAVVESEIAAQAARDASDELIDELEDGIADTRARAEARDTRRWAEAIGAFTDTLVAQLGQSLCPPELLERMRNVLSLMPTSRRSLPAGGSVRSKNTGRSSRRSARAMPTPRPEAYGAFTCTASRPDSMGAIAEVSEPEAVGSDI